MHFTFDQWLKVKQTIKYTFYNWLPNSNHVWCLVVLKERQKENRDFAGAPLKNKDDTHIAKSTILNHIATVNCGILGGCFLVPFLAVWHGHHGSFFGEWYLLWKDVAV